MTQELKDKLKMIKIKQKTVCAECQSGRSYTNPMDKCDECKMKYCFDHLSNGQINDAMAENEEARSICDDCIIKHSYREL